MASVARLVGMELRQYKKDGEQRQYCGLHFEYLPDSIRDVMGSKVEVISCPREVDPNKLEVGTLYEMEIETYQMKGQMMARLVGFTPV